MSGPSETVARRFFHAVDAEQHANIVSETCSERIV
jgi:hypothetical protein